MSEILSGTYDHALSLESIRDFIVLATLDDKPIERDSKQLVIDVVTNHIAIDNDIYDRKAIEILTLDIMPMGGDEGFEWNIEMSWVVWCDEEDCGHVARQQTRFSGCLCDAHLDEAYKQNQADLENDDIKAGMRE